MKSLLIALIAISGVAAQAEVVRSEDAQVSIARVTSVDAFKEGEVQASIAVQDHGGSTDVSPTETVFLTLYRKGEMFSTDATFKIESVVAFEKARRVSAGVYELTARDTRWKKVTYRIDARKALKEINAVDCGDEFDCGASTNFASEVNVTVK